MFRTIRRWLTREPWHLTASDDVAQLQAQLTAIEAGLDEANAEITAWHATHRAHLARYAADEAAYHRDLHQRTNR